MRQETTDIGTEVTTDAQKLSGIRPNIVDILILITAVSKTSLYPKE